MKRFCVVIAGTLLSCLYANSQVATKYFPQKNATEDIPELNSVRIGKVINLPYFDIKEVEKEDEETNSSSDSFRFGKGFDVTYTLSDGTWGNLEEGRLWTLSFQSGGAKSLIFVFDDFSLPNGAQLYISNKEKTVLYGPVTKETIPDNHHFLTDIIPGDAVTLFLYEPKEEEGNSKLTIKRIVHGYKSFGINGLKGHNSSLPCNIDVSNYYPDYERESDAVALALSEDGTCRSGFLVMTTDFSFKKYFMTAFHCIDKNPQNNIISEAEKETAEKWLFKFNYKEENFTGNPTTISYTYNGDYFRAAWSSTDFALLELKQNFNTSHKPTWLGWDRSGTTPSSGTCIHHPQGDVMKIALSYYPLSTSGFYWLSYWNDGLTEGGSSGSPLLDSQHRVVGQLFSGSYNSCNSSTHYDLFGMFNGSWYGGGNDTTRLSNWLDPIGTNQMTTDLNSESDLKIKRVGNNMYYIEEVPNGYDLSWSFLNPNSIYSNRLHVDTLRSNYCYIDYYVGENFSETLVASLSLNGSTVKTLSTSVLPFFRYIGTYEQEGDGGNAPIEETDFFDNNTLYVNNSGLITLKSSYFRNKYITHTGATLSNWNYDNNETITLEFSNNSFFPRTLTITGYEYLFNDSLPSNCVNFMFAIHRSNPPLRDFPFLLSYDNKTITISTGETECDGIQNDYIVEITNLETRDYRYKGLMNNNNISINTFGWKSGMYVVQISTGKEQYSQKIFVR